MNFSQRTIGKIGGSLASVTRTPTTAFRIRYKSSVANTDGAATKARQYTVKRPVTNTSHVEVLNGLKAGNERFVSGQTSITLNTTMEKLKKYAAEGQKPRAVVLCCSDSRAPVEMVFDQDLGDIFVIRVAGNIVAPSVVGSIEYAVSTFGTPLVVVMGHTQCGAVKATVDHIMNSTSIPTESIHDIVARIKPHVYNVCQAENVSVDEKVKQATTDNVIASCNELWHSSRLIEGLIAEDKLSIIGSVFQLETGQVKFLEDEVN